MPYKDPDKYRECMRVAQAKLRANRTAADKVKVASDIQAWRAANSEKVSATKKAWTTDNRERHLACSNRSSRNRYAAKPKNPCRKCGGVKKLGRGEALCAPCRTSAKAEKIEYTRGWFKANPDKVNAKVSRRRASKLSATPPWLTTAQHAEIASWYRKGSAAKLDVDHIVPLQGENVCGLHVPWNLQLLTRFDNLSKGNRMPRAAA